MRSKLVRSVHTVPKCSQWLYRLFYRLSVNTVPARSQTMGNEGVNTVPARWQAMRRKSVHTVPKCSQAQWEHFQKVSVPTVHTVPHPLGCEQWEHFGVHTSVNSSREGETLC